LKPQINKILLVLLLLGVVAACTTTKKRSEMSALSELYHNTTAHYNGYFNANELYVASQALLEQQHRDNYTKILPMYKYLATEDASAVVPDLDIAMEKVSVVVNLHPYSKWTDDCYLLFGKAQYLKRDYESAEETWRYFEGEFNPEAIARKDEKAKVDKKVNKSKKKKKKSRKRKKSRKKKNKTSKKKARALKKYNKAVRKARKSGGKAPEKPVILQSGSQAAEAAKEEKRKENEEKLAEEEKSKPAEEKPEDGVLKHRLAYQEGMLYYARTLIERDKFDDAQRILETLLGSGKTFEDIRAQAAAAQAYLFIETEKYVNALPALEEAIELEKDKYTKARYAFIMAQLYDRLRNSTGAYAGYEQCLTYRPPYEMEFNCRLNMAQNAWASGDGGPQEARRKLERMLKEEKNAEYKDQIYFALAMIAFREGDRPEGIRNLELSLQQGGNNQAQKAEAYLTLADLYFEDEEYVAAKSYYDSTLTVIGKNDERQPRVEKLANNLEDIAKNLSIIALQDSLLRISEMSIEEQEALAMRIKRKRDEERRKQLIAQANRAANSRSFGGSNIRGQAALGGAPESSFFAYDERSLRRGSREFQRTWGARPLEDNWRRSSASSGAALDDLSSGGDDSEPDILTEDEIKQLLGDVPRTEGEVAAARLKTQEAMAALGRLYRERLNNTEKAIAILEELNSRYPDNSFELDSWYQLYLAYMEIGNTAKAKEYGDKIVQKYPDTNYAMIIRNPNYAEELAKEEKKLERYYEDAYAAFKAGNYQRAYGLSSTAKEKFGAANELQPKFALLTAMSTGNLEGKDAYIEALRSVVARYPDTEEQLRAREILRLLGQTTASLPAGAKEELQKFADEPDKLHYVIVAFSSKDIDLNQCKIAVSDYNQKYHKLDRIRISNLFLGVQVEDRVPILVLRRYKDKAEAMRYYEGVQNKKGEYMGNQNVDFEVLPVTQNNYREILKQRSVENYRVFFQEYYAN
jgi:tetratricopeptide (TPR) repeat protein